MPSFARVGLNQQIVQSLRAQGLTEAFDIQAAAIPDALAGKNVLGRAPTGSGKTFAFGLPMLHRLAGRPSMPKTPRGLILAPTRELADQIGQRLADPAAACGLRLVTVFGGVPIAKHIRQLAAPVDVLVATPGRVQDLIARRCLDVRQVEITALDEADQMADMGFIPQVRAILRYTPATGQRLLFSATLDGQVADLVKEFVPDAVTHSTAPAQARVDTMEHYVISAGAKENRNDIVARLAAREGSTIIFVRAKYTVDRQVKKLRKVGIPARGIHGDKGQSSRTTALREFASGKAPVLVATDIAARGLDISSVDLVVHLDPPAEHKAYVHRAGRTARAGKSGVVVTIMCEGQEKQVASVMSAAGITPTYLEGSDVAAWSAVTGATQPPGTPVDSPAPPYARNRKQTSRRSNSRRKNLQQKNNRQKKR